MKNGNVNPNNTNNPSNMPVKHNHLEGLKGRMVTLYRGGPESKSGMLLDVKSDYVALYDAQNNKEDNQDDNKQNSNTSNPVIYYRLHHLKSISEDTKSNSTQMSGDHNIEVEFLEGNNFAEIIKGHENEFIQVNQGGPESKKGVLVSLDNDCLVLFTEDDGIVYYNLHHIKSMFKVQMEKESENGQNEEMALPSYTKVSNFKDVFSCMSHKWVSINRGGPEAMEGVLVENSGSHYTLVNNQEVIRISPFHIRNISSGPKGSMNNTKQEKNNKNEKEKKNSVDDKHGRDSKRSHCRDTKRSHSRDTKRSHCRDTRKSHCRDTKRSHSRDTKRSHSRDTKRSHSRDTRRSHSRDTKRSHSRDTRRSHSRDTRKSHCRDTKRSHSRDTRRSHCRDTKRSHSRDIRRSHSRDSRRSHCIDTRRSHSRDSRRSHCIDTRRSHSRDSRRSLCIDTRRSHSRDSRRSLCIDTRRSHSRDSRVSFCRDTRRSHSRDSRRSYWRNHKRPQREIVVKTIDYVWKS